jgi:hypothetical protein
MKDFVYPSEQVSLVSLRRHDFTPVRPFLTQAV